MEEYKNMVRTMVTKEEGTFNDLLQDAFDHIGLN